MFFKNSMGRQFLLPAMGIGAFIVGGVLFAPSLNSPVSALEMTRVGSSFQKAPRLSSLSAIGTELSGAATYSFRIKVPEGAGASLQAVRVSQVGGVDTVVLRAIKAEPISEIELQGLNPFPSLMLAAATNPAF
jgi:hypothetical protein